jgi:thiol-disulfide isomerase/thioredoxin
VLPVVFVGVALALIAAIVFSSNESINSGNETGEPELTGEALPPYDSGAEPANDGGVGSVAPAATGEDFDGSAVSITPGDGTPRVVVFLAHWCPHCQAEVPRIQQWLDEGGGVDGVELMSVTTSVNSAQPNYPPSEWLEREGWTPENLLDSSDNEVYTAYGGGAFPFFVFMDGDGNVVRRASGELDVATLEAYMLEIAG